MDEALPDFPVVLYDGACAFCQRSIRFIHENDRSGSIRFLSLQHPLAAHWLNKLGVNRMNLPDSLIFIHQQRIYVQADAVLQIGRMMGGLWMTAGYLGKLIPFKNHLYAFIARRRGKIKVECPMPSPAFRAKVIG
jgi:predicted DCC family thiol-disulfide oxidoreductase YuxK